MKKLDRLLFLYPLLLLTSTLLMRQQKYEIAFLITLFYTLVYGLLIIKSKEVDISKKYGIEKTISKEFSLKRVLTILISLPILLMILIIFPFKEDYLYNLIIVYSIFGVMTGIYLMNYRVHFLRIGHHFKGLKYLIPGLIISGAIGFLNYRFLSNVYFNQDLITILGIIFVSYITTLYFRGLIQNFLSNLKGAWFVILFVALIMTIIQLVNGSLAQVTSMFISSIVIGYFYLKSRNLYLVFFMELTINLIQYVILFNRF